MNEQQNYVRNMMKRALAMVYDMGAVTSSVAVIDQISAVWFLYYYWTEPNEKMIRDPDYYKFIEGDEDTKLHIRSVVNQSEQNVPFQIVDIMSEALYKMNTHLLRDLLKIMDEMFGRSQALTIHKGIIDEMQVESFQILLEEMDYEKDPDLAPTPDDLARLMAGIATQELTSNRRKIRVFDPCCGTGSLLVAAYREIVSLKLEVEIYGTDIASSMIRICYMNLLLHGVEEINLFPADALRDDALPNKKFDMILSQLPFSSIQLAVLDTWIFEGVNVTDREILFLKTIEKHMGNPSVVSVLTTDSIWRTTRLNDYRKKLISEYVISGGVELPMGTLYSYQKTDAAILFLGQSIEQSEVAVFTSFDPQSFSYEEFKFIWSSRSSLWNQTQVEHYIHRGSSFLLVPKNRIRRAKLSPNYYLLSTPGLI